MADCDKAYMVGNYRAGILGKIDSIIFLLVMIGLAIFMFMNTEVASVVARFIP